ncbi:MAG: Ig-like domain-containing protein [Ruminococcus flavefaciens]|nr:Ig-like domain-containing protein [Ruminococcus flavefaciens]
MKKRKLLFTALCLSIVAAFTCGLTACGKKTSPEDVHTHSWNGWTVTAENKPTANKTGKATRSCSAASPCDGTEEDKEYELPVLTSADYSKTADSATCLAAGVITYTYYIDGESVSFDVQTPANPDKHSWNKEYTVDKPATCEEDGSESIHCALCGTGKEGTSKAIGKLGHSWDEGEITKTSTCIKEGEKTFTCTRDNCGETKTEAVAKSGHVMDKGEVTTTATCEGEGEMTFSCTVSGCEYSRTEAIPANGHSWKTEYTVDKPATCEEDGSESIHCSVCDKVKENSSKPVASLGKEHVWEEGNTVDTPATCEEDGSESIHCSVCGTGKQGSSQTIAKLGHSWNEGEITKNPTCTEEGEKTFTCTRDNCNETKTESVAASGHTWKTEYTVDEPATCEEDGSESIHCAVCDAVKENSSRPIASLGQTHSWSESYTVDVPATCKDEGSESIHCTVCGTSKQGTSRPLSKIAHTWEEGYTVDVPATCEEEGSESVHCAVCGTGKEGSLQTVAKLGHSWDEGEITKNPTCIKEGEKTFTCTRDNCNETKTEAVAKSGHVMDKGKVTTPATCEEAGERTFGCTTSGCVHTETEIIPATGHDWNVKYTYTDGTGHFKICKNNGEHKTEPEDHDTKGEDGACSECGYNPEPVGTEEGELSDNNKSTTVKVGGGNTATVNGYTRADGYWTYTYNGVKPITVDYRYYIFGEQSERQGTVTLSANGETSFVVYLGNRATCYMTITSSEPAAFDATITADYSEEDPNPAPIPAENALTLGEERDITVDYFGKAYTFTAGVAGEYKFTCTGDKVDLLVGAAGKEVEKDLPYTFTLKAGESVRFLLCSPQTGKEANATALVELVAAAHIHEWNDGYTVDKPATCKEEGVESIHCKGCDEVKENSERKISKLAHSWNDGEVTKEPTCTEEGVKCFACENCDATKTETVAASGHDWNEKYTVDKPATCEEDGSESIHCAVCDAVKENSSRPVESLGKEHVWNDGYTVDVPATCSKEGSESIHCSLCNTVKDGSSRAIAKLAHTWEENHTVDVPATCSKEGSESIHCAVCDAVKEGSSRAIAKLAHTWEEDYTVDTPATCEEAGYESIHCKECGEKKDGREIQATGHSYGDWVIKLPSASEKGEAKKVCANDKDHTITVELPVLPESGNGGYASIAPDEDDAFLTVYTYTDAQYGDIVFAVSAKLTVEDAVNLAVAKNREAVEGTVIYDQHIIMDESTTVHDINTFEYGDDYLHIKDNSDNVEYWYSHYNGKLFAIKSQEYTYSEIDGEDGPVLWQENVTKIIKDKDAYLPGMEKKIFDGYSMTFWLLGSGHREYGVANYISYLYNMGKADVNGDFEESIDVSDGVTTYKFSFGLFEDGNNKYFHVVEVSFTLNEGHVIVSAVLDTKTYVNSAYKHVGNGHYIAVGEFGNHETFTVTQSTSYASGVKPVNTHSYEELTVGSFTLMSNGREVVDKLELTVDSTTVLTIANLSPSTCNLEIDPVVLLLRKQEDGGSSETELEYIYTEGKEGNILARYDYDKHTITLTPYIAGEFTLLVKTLEITKEIHLSIPFTAPTEFGAQVYKVVDESLNRAEWRKYDTEFTAYTNQALAFTSYVGIPEYENPAFTATATNGAQIFDGEVNGEQVKMFSAATAGEYTVTLTSSNGKTASFKVIVKEAPTYEEILSGKYVNEDEAITVEFHPELGSATIMKGEDPVVFTEVKFICDASGAVTTEHISGEDFGYEFEITERLTLFTSYTDGNGEKRIYLHKEGDVVSDLMGNYKLTNAANAIEHVVTVSGLYTVEYDPNCGSSEDIPYTRFYEINDGEQVRGVPLSVTLKLNAGDTFKVYAASSNINTGSFIYNISFVYISEKVTGVTLDKTEMDVGLNCTETLNATINPANATVKSVIWTSSDKEVATVSGSGEVTGKAYGTAVITATTVDGDFVATCTVTVVRIPVERIELDCETLSFTFSGGVGSPARIKITATVYPTYATDQELVVVSSNEKVVTFSTYTYNATAAGVGTATITFTSKSDPSVTAVCTVTVSAPEVEPTGITLDKTSHKFKVGETFTLTATVAPDDAVNKSVTWTTSNASVATVANGVVTGVGEGTATITATTFNGKKATCEVTVPVHPKSVTLNRESREITEDGTFTLTATVAPDNAEDKSVIWTTSDASVATVDAYGKVTGVGEGTAIITATTCNGLTATCNVTVKAEPPAVVVPTGITLNITSYKIEQGKTFTLTATVSPENVTDETVRWTTSNASVATVANGVVTGVGVGTATITAITCNDLTVECAVTVDPVQPTGITLSKTSHSIEKGKTFTLTATVVPANAADKSVIWTSSDESVATVENGKVTGVGVGTATITAETSNGIKAKCTVTVSEPQPTGSITLDRESVTLMYDPATGEGDSIYITATITPASVASWGVLWVSSNTSVATVNYGTVTAKGVGTAIITATSNKDSTLIAECIVTVVAPEVKPTGITLDNTSCKVEEGETFTLTATVAPDDAADKSVTWTTSNASVATVENGVVTGVGEGTAVITATTCNGYTATCEVTVPVQPKSITLSAVSREITTSGMFALYATVAPDDAADKSVTWTTSDASIATVDESGKVTGVGEGTATITATACNGLTATCNVTVVAEPPAVVEPTGITLDKTSCNIEKKNSFTLIATVAPENVTNGIVSWGTSNASVATVANGVVTGVGVGTATITATTCNGIVAECVVTVDPIKPNGIMLNKGSLDIVAGEAFTLTASVTPEDTDDKTIIWSTSNASVAIVVNGVVTGVGEGTATITAKTGNGIEATCEVTVTEITIELSSESITFSSATLARQTLTATVLPASVQSALVWSVSKEGVVSLNDGSDSQSRTVTSIGYGFVDITVSLASNPAIKAVCKVRVGSLATSVSFASSDLELTLGEDNKTNRFTVSPSNLADKTFTVEVSDPSVLDVEYLDIGKDGTSTTFTFKPKQVGTATVTVTMNDGSGCQAVCNVTVSEAAEEGEIGVGVNEIPEVEVDFMMGCGYLEINLSAGTYSITATRNGELIDNFNIYNGRYSYGALGNSCEITVGAGITVLKIVESGCKSTIPAFTLTITKIA